MHESVESGGIGANSEPAPWERRAAHLLDWHQRKSPVVQTALMAAEKRMLYPGAETKRIMQVVLWAGRDEFVTP